MRSIRALISRARESVPQGRADVRRILAARRFSKSSVKLFLLAYMTGAVLLLPTLLSSPVSPARGVGVASDSTVGGPVAQDRSALAPRGAAVTTDVADVLRIRTYVVSADDTLGSIAERFGLKPETIAYDNALGSSGAVHAGQTLNIPAIDAAIYYVKQGDTVFTVAKKFGVDATAIMDTDRLYFEPDNFAVGKALIVPVPDATYPDFALEAVARAASSTVARGQPPEPIPAAPTGSVVAPMQHRLQWPVNGVITQGFWSGHLGVDIAAPYGTPIGASDAGVVSAAGWVAVGGLRVCVKHDWGMTTCYYHTSSVYVSVGQHVARGQPIAAIGLTGVTTGPHVHWEANLNGVLVNPLLY